MLITTVSLLRRRAVVVVLVVVALSREGHGLGGCGGVPGVNAPGKKCDTGSDDTDGCSRCRTVLRTAVCRKWRVCVVFGQRQA